MRRLVGGIVAVITAGAACLGATSASGSLAQDTVVSENPVNYTPNVESDGTVGHPAIYALAQSGSTMYAGGALHLVQDARRTTSYLRHNLFSFSATDGSMTTFAPSLDGEVWAIEAVGSSLYVGGYFQTVDGLARRGIVKMDAATGAVDTTFNASFTSGGVQEIELVNGRLVVGGTFPQRLLALNPSTGADTGYVDIPITGKVASNAGRTNVYRFAVSPDGSRLVGIGNFTSVGGQARSRAFMLSLGAASATLNAWYYQPLTKMCRATKLPAYLRGVDFSPDGKWFVIDSTGYVPATDAGIGTDLCDAAARFETGIATPSKPTWINYTGGDTLHSVAVTGSVVYVQGHQRWLDNPDGRDFAGPGATSRPGIGALDPVTGHTIGWNPTKTRGVGGKAFLVTPAGLWVGSDGTRFNGEYRKGIAFAPLPTP